METSSNRFLISIAVFIIAIIVLLSILDKKENGRFNSIIDGSIKVISAEISVTASNIRPDLKGKSLDLSTRSIEELKTIISNSTDGEGRKKGLYNEMLTVNLKSEDGKIYQVRLLKNVNENLIILFYVNPIKPIMLENSLVSENTISYLLENGM